MSKKKKYAPRTPLHAGGIRLQWLRGTPVAGDFAAAERFLSSMRPKDIDGRLAKGRRYAESGQTVSLEIDGSKVEALVVGARTQPYKVSIRFREPGEEQKKRIAAALEANPVALANLYAGVLPPEAEDAFKAEGLDLFPGGKLAEGVYDMTTSCTCPDWANPCKHAMAVLYLLAEEVGRRPLTMLELRGIRNPGTDGLDASANREPVHARPSADIRLAPQAAKSGIRRPKPDVPPFPFWKGEKKFVKAIEEILSIAAKRIPSPKG